ncbi:MAG: hypothetical protein IJR40_09360 [Treponema sp.]|nr:hypothetical protein [Treponema sp.]
MEVKSGKSGSLRSLHSYIDMTKTDLAVRLWSGGISAEQAVTPLGRTPYTLISLPLFLAGRVTEYLRGLEKAKGKLEQA